MYTTEIFDLSISDVLDGYDIQLRSDHILENAHISWANEGQSEGKNRYQLYDHLYIGRCILMIGQEIQNNEQQSFLRCRRYFYTVNNEICD